MERNLRKTRTGKVVSNKMDKTIVVEVASAKRHKMYGKRVKNSTKFLAHDENNVANEGDVVTIMETRPLSARKHFRLLEVVEKAQVL